MALSFLERDTPVIAAPMAGGATTVALAAGASAAGAFPFLAAGYKTVEALGDEIAALRGSATAFGVNLFVPGTSAVDAPAFSRYADALAEEAAAYGLRLDPVPRYDDDAWNEKVALLCADPVQVVSVTFGLPPASDIALLRRAGSTVLVTVTTAAEAREAAAAGVDGLVVQGPGAGGHSATWDPRRTVGDATTANVLGAVRAATTLPLIAAGGVDGPGAVRELLARGAAAVAVGTLLLRTEEAGTSPSHRAALASNEYPDTVITRVFTGRPARALRNGFVDRHTGHELTAYPAVHHLTRELRKRAGIAGDRDRLHLWAGTGFRAARSGPVADTIAWLASRI